MKNKTTDILEKAKKLEHMCFDLIANNIISDHHIDINLVFKKVTLRVVPIKSAEYINFENYKK
jgi:hypothetical protein